MARMNLPRYVCMPFLPNPLLLGLLHRSTGVPGPRVAFCTTFYLSSPRSPSRWGVSIPSICPSVHLSMVPNQPPGNGEITHLCLFPFKWMCSKKEESAAVSPCLQHLDIPGCGE